MSNSTVAFGYDASGARLWKQGAPTNSLQVWIDGIYEEKDGKILYHVLAGDRIVCTFDSTGITTEYYHPDQLHSTAVETDSSGNSYQHYEYSAFGQSRYTLSTTAFPVSRRYTAQVLDEETGLYFYGSRYYDPQLGRFIQPDPIIPDAFNPQSYDRYAYALNNPLRYTDPDGHWGQEVADWWSGVVNRGAGYISASPSHWIWNGTVGTVNSLVGGLAAPLGLGSAAGSVSGNPNATGWQIAGATVQEGANLAALVPAAAGAGKAVSTLVRAGEKEAVGELAGALGGCFLAGTLVPTESGNVEIQTVKAGDRVWSYSMTTAEWELRSVEATPVHDYTGDIITIGVGGAVIEATDNHPFWVVSGDEIASRPLATDVPEDERAFNPSGRWVEARSLRVGDVVLLLGGETATITGLSERQEHLAVYNLRVEVNHTYAVSQAGVLVHNKAAQIKPVPKEGTYEFPDKQAPGKTYVGQSGDLPKRLGTHEKTGRKAPGTEAQTTEVPGGKTQREMQEQRRIDQLGGTRGKPGSQTSNQRNPVSPERQKQLGMKPNEN
jgi:RHS repeat-associated protein